MKDRMVALKTSCHVLKAVIERRTPDEADVEKLRRYALLLRDIPIDEGIDRVACEVVFRLSKRSEARTASPS
jgi:hypothetical protein